MSPHLLFIRNKNINTAMAQEVDSVVCLTEGQ